MQVPKRRSEQNVKRDSGPLLITSDGLGRLQRTLTRLERGISDMVKEVERTKEHGDFSENAAYQDAKATLRRTYSRIANIQDKIKRAQIITKGAQGGIIGLGSVVVLDAGGKRLTFEILGPHEADPSKGRISNQSPLGQALMERKAGDTVSVATKKGQTVYTIAEVR